MYLLIYIILEEGSALQWSVSVFHPAEEVGPESDDEEEEDENDVSPALAQLEALCHIMGT